MKGRLPSIFSGCGKRIQSLAEKENTDDLNKELNEEVMTLIFQKRNSDAIEALSGVLLDNHLSEEMKKEIARRILKSEKALNQHLHGQGEVVLGSVGLTLTGFGILDVGTAAGGMGFSTLGVMVTSLAATTAGALVFISAGTLAGVAILAFGGMIAHGSRKIAFSKKKQRLLEICKNILKNP